MMQKNERTAQAQVDRRQVLHAGAAGGLGLSLFGLLNAKAAAEQVSPLAPAKIRACIFVYLYGGPSHIDTFDPKPAAPASVRGEFKPISTSAPGVQISEHLPNIAKWMHKAALVRSMHHANRLHDSAGIETFTGRQGPNGDREEFAPIPQFFPCHGAVLNYLRRDQGFEAAHAVLPWLFHNVVDVPCQGGGFLGRAYDPFLIHGEPEKSGFLASMFARREGLSAERMAARRRLLAEVSVNETISVPQSRRLRAMYDRAFSLIGSQKLRQALRIDQEDEQTRQRYGLYEYADRGGVGGGDQAYGRNLRGQNLLIARRLVEAGVPFVNVHDFRQQGQNWDSHKDNFKQHKDHLLPPIDRALSALLEDLDERGMLDETLVVVTGEFGRSPTINGNAGRDHWPDCYSLLIAGGGVQGGAVHGASDRNGAFPARDEATPADLAATIYWRFGIDPATKIHDLFGRPYHISEGKPLTGLFG